LSIEITGKQGFDHYTLFFSIRYINNNIL